MKNTAEVNGLFSEKHNFSLLHYNIRSVSKNLNSLHLLLAEHKFQYDVVALTETWLRSDEYIHLQGYHLACLPRQSKARAGGVLFYIKAGYSFKSYPSLTNRKTPEYGTMFTELPNNLVTGVIYRSPGAKVGPFLDQLESAFEQL